MGGAFTGLLQSDPPAGCVSGLCLFALGGHAHLDQSPNAIDMGSPRVDSAGVMVVLVAGQLRELVVPAAHPVVCNRGDSEC